MPYLADNLISYWKLDESSGNAADTVASYTLTNTNTVAYGAALINNGADFSASNTNKSLTKSVFTTANNFSVQCWVKLRTEIASGSYTFLTWNSQNVGTLIALNYNYNGGTRQIQFNRQGNSSFSVSVTANLTMGTSTWHHFVMTYDSANIKLYVDGVLKTPTVSTVDSAGAFTDTSITLGCAVDAGSSATSNFSSCYIDESATWSRVLSQTDVTNLYNGGLGLAYPLPTKTTVLDTQSTTDNIAQSIKAQSVYSDIQPTIDFSTVSANRWSNQSKSSDTWTNQQKST